MSYISIDWEAQWALHAPGFREGYLPIAIGDRTLRLCSGPGFGNLSHPTTCLMLALMTPHIPGKVVLDIGTGSGILALAAAALQAKQVIALDIDPLALEHARENAALNGLSIQFALGDEQPEVTLLNMIFSEQREALSSLPPPQGLLLSSGILVEQREEYLQYTSQQGWKLIEELEKEGWLSFLFKILYTPSTPNLGLLAQPKGQDLG